MRLCVLAALLLAACAAGASAARLPEPAAIQRIAEAALLQPPSFPDAYEMRYRFSMPYFKLLQPGGLSYYVHVWVDKAAESVRIDFRDGIDKTLFVKNEEYAITPHRYELVCAEYKHGGGPVASGARAGELGLPTGMLGKQVLPNMKDWVPYGPAEVDGKPAHMWQLKEMAGEKVNTYTFYVAEDGSPLKFHSIGQDFFAGSHFDEYNYEWTMFKPGPVDPAVFEIPELCKKKPDAAGAAVDAGAGGDAGAAAGDAEQQAAARHHVSLQALALLPGNHAQHKDEAHYFGWAHAHERAHESTAAYLTRLAAFTANKAKIAAHNARAAAAAAARAAAASVTRANSASTAAAGDGADADAPTHSLALNRFADWPREEFDRVMLPRKWRREHGLDVTRMRPPPLRTFTATLDKHKLPKSLDWRSTPADFAVKDQGQCGSCWAFAAAGTMEGSWFVATGSPRSFSEQQLIDCAWPEGPHGCDGGDYQPAFRYVAKAGGLAATQDYPYVGQNDFCRDNTTSLTGHFHGYVEVASKDEAAVMEALLKHGPLAVGVDATFDEFLFYSEGVYRDKRCTLKPAALDHAVILVGWGTDARSGEDYWIVKNSWSKFWGDDGYIKIHRGGNDCGIASDAAFAEVPQEYVVPGAAEAAQQLALANARA